MEQALDDPGDAPDLLLDRAQAPAGVVSGDGALEQLRVALDHAHGRPDLVGEPGHQRPDRGEAFRDAEALAVTTGTGTQRGQARTASSAGIRSPVSAISMATP